jgi:DNA-binding beta-propeller fold protein YncE/ABC-type Fe3+ transport system permease subunit
VLPAGAAGLWIAAVGYPALALIGVSITAAGGAAELRRTGGLLLTSTGWAAAVTVGAVLLGWGPGRVLGRALARRGYAPLAALFLAPICLPAYVIFYAWWQSWPADSALHRWAIETDRLQIIKALTLLIGFLCWSWPLVAWCVAGSAAATPAHRDELLRLDGAGPLRRFIDRLRGDGRELAMGGLIVFLFVFNHTTSFDIAQIFTFGYELRAIDALNAGPRAILAAAAPALVIGVLGAVAIWVLLGRTPAEAPVRPGRITVGGGLATAAVWVATVVVPMVLFAGNLGGGRTSIRTFLSLYGSDVANTIAVAFASGLLGSLVAIGLAAAWHDHRAWVRLAAHGQAIGWLLAGVVPGTLVGVACEAAYNRPVLDDVIYTTPAVLVLAYLARFAFIGALLARWMTRREPRVLGEVRRLDGAETLVGFVQSSWPRVLAAGGAAFAVVGVLSVSDLSVASRLQPIGFGAVATDVLNAVHYQRPETVLLASLSLVGVGLAAGGLAVAVWWPLRRFSPGAAAGMIGLATLVALGGCAHDDPDHVPPLEARLTFGSPGVSLGQFNYPRGIAVDGQRRLVYIVDKTARVQRFTLSGQPQHQWRMPQWENGKPTGLNVSPDGRVFVADTHYHRVIAYDGDGRELMRFGRYGRGPGELIYPTDVAFGPQGRIYVSEYGGNERVGVFGPDGEFLFSFGSPGSQLGQFNRPQALAFNEDRTELYVADACNHRIVVVDPEGRPRRVLGGPGRGPGQLAYPYDVMILRDGSLLVCEFGNNRIQRLSPTGECRGLFGRVGTGDGELQYPWGIDGTDAAIFVLDSGNNRVQVMKEP